MKKRRKPRPKIVGWFDELARDLTYDWDKFRLRAALFAFWWARGTITAVRRRRGRGFLGPECGIIDRRPSIYTELDQAEDRRRVLSTRF